MTARTTSIAEALFLLEHGNKLTRMEMVADWPRGIESCSFAFEGEGAEADRHDYSESKIDLDLMALMRLFDSIEALMIAKAVRP